MIEGSPRFRDFASSILWPAEAAAQQAHSPNSPLKIPRSLRSGGGICLAWLPACRFFNGLLRGRIPFARGNRWESSPPGGWRAAP